MDQPIIQSIFQARSITYALTDRNLVIRAVHGHPEMISEFMPNSLDLSLLEIFPELLGNQPELFDILEGKSDSLRLVYINREIEGQTRYLTMESLPFLDEIGQIAGLIHVVQDETLKGELEQQVTQDRNELRLLKEKIEQQNIELMTANKELRRSKEQKAQFIHVASRELRNPLNSLLSYAKTLSRGQVGILTEQQSSVIKIVLDQGQRLQSMVDELINAVRLEAGQIDLQLQPVDLIGLARKAVDEFAPQIKAKSQTLSLELSYELPSALCDENWTKQIVTNLLSNANKFAPVNGQISLRVGLAEQAGFLQLSVADSGSGITGSTQVDIFERWNQSKESGAAHSIQGSGMGLYITRSLVELNGGSIWYETQPELGCVFHVTLPIAE